MEFNEDSIKEKLKEYNENDIYFLKKEWRGWIKNRDFEKFMALKGANLQVIYNIFKPEKILSIKQAKYDPKRIEIKLRHSFNYEILVIAIFDEPEEGKLGIVTYTKEEIRRR